MYEVVDAQWIRSMAGQPSCLSQRVLLSEWRCECADAPALKAPTHNVKIALLKQALAMLINESRKDEHSDSVLLDEFLSVKEAAAEITDALLEGTVAAIINIEEWRTAEASDGRTWMNMCHNNAMVGANHRHYKGKHPGGDLLFRRHTWMAIIHLCLAKHERIHLIKDVNTWHDIHSCDHVTPCVTDGCVAFTTAAQEQSSLLLLFWASLLCQPHHESTE